MSDSNRLSAFGFRLLRRASDSVVRQPTARLDLDIIERHSD
jgi:hypothetical protein